MKKIIVFSLVVLLSMSVSLQTLAAHSIALPTEHVVHDVDHATQNGVSIVVTIQPLEEEIVATGEAFVDEMQDTTGIVHWLQVTHDGDTSLPATITFVTNLLPGTAVRVIHKHEGSWRIVPGHESTIVTEGGLLTITFDHLSPVGLVVLSVPTDDGNVGDSTGNDTGDSTTVEDGPRRSPQTGVRSYLGLAMTGFIGSVVGLMVVVKGKK